jgi:hypothetical protein
MKDQVKDIAVRALKTFVQAFIAALAVANFTDQSNYKAVLIGAVSAGVSATWNSLLAANASRK